MTTRSDLAARREAHEVALRDVRWFSTQELAARWRVSVQTVRAIPAAQLPFKEFGAGEKLKRRRYRQEWVEAYEAVRVAA